MASDSHRPSILTDQEIDDLYGLPRLTDEDRGLYFELSMAERKVTGSIRTASVALRSLTEDMDTMPPSGELLFHVFGALAQYERALTLERVIAGLAVAKRRGRMSGRPPAIVSDKLEAIVAALKGGRSKAAKCRNFGVKRTTLIETLARIGWPDTQDA